MAEYFTEGIAKQIIEKKTEPILSGLVKIAQKEWEKFKVDFDFSFVKYSRNSYDKYSRIKTILYKAEPQFIYDFFEVPFLSKNGKSILADDVDRILDNSHFIIIQGIGGIGKSTLMKHLFINELEKKDLIPIFFELKDINDIKTEYDILDCIFERLFSLGSDISRDALQYALKTGCFLFLLDGYDEIVTDKRNEFLKKLDSFCDRYSDNYFVISSRPYSEFVELQRFTVLSTCPFTKKQAISLITKLSFDVDVKERFITAIEERLYDSHKSFASNPLLLSIMLLTFDNYAEIPEKLHIFYANAFETLYEKHDATKAGYRREIRSALSYDSFRTVFSYFCFISYAQGKIEFTKDELVETIKKITIRGIAFDAESFIYDLSNSLCVIYRDGLDYKFTHRSFQEYFTAFFLKELSDTNMGKMSRQIIYKDTYRATHDNVFYMLRDMTEDRFESNILLPIIKGIEQERGEESSYDFYFRIIVDEVKYDYDYRNNGHKLELWLSSSSISSVPWFVYHLASNHFARGNAADHVHEEAAEELKKYLLKGEEEHRVDISYERIIEDTRIYALLKKTWIGENILAVSKLKDEIEKKQRETEIDLSNLLDG